METIVVFIYIPALSLDNIIHFYESTLYVKFIPIDYGDEMMAFIPVENSKFIEVIS